MDRMPEGGRQAAHIMLDTLSAWDGDEDQWSASANLALRRLDEVGAYTASFDDETATLTFDASNLLGGMIVAMQWLTTMLAAERGVEPEAVIVELREWLDRE